MKTNQYSVATLLAIFLAVLGLAQAEDKSVKKEAPDPGKPVVKKEAPDPGKPVVKKEAPNPNKPLVKKDPGNPGKPVVKKNPADPNKPVVKKDPGKPGAKKPDGDPGKPQVKKPGDGRAKSEFAGILNRCDENRDSVVSLAEFQKQAAGKDTGSVAQWFQVHDRDKDGNLSEQDFAPAVSKKS